MCMYPGGQVAECANFRALFSGVLSPSVHTSGHRKLVSNSVGDYAGNAKSYFREQSDSRGVSDPGQMQLDTRILLISLYG